MLFESLHMRLRAISAVCLRENFLNPYGVLVLQCTSLTLSKDEIKVCARRGNGQESMMI